MSTSIPSFNATSASVLGQQQAAQPSKQQSPVKAQLQLLTTGDTREHWENLPSLVSGFKAFSNVASPNQDTLKLSTGNHNIGKGPLGGELSVLVNNLMGLDFAAFGNLDADLYPQDLNRVLNQANYKVLSNNAFLTAGTTDTQVPSASNPFQPAVNLAPAIVEGSQGRYGVIGLTIPGLHKEVNPNHPGQELSVQDFDTTVAMTQQHVQNLTQAGIDKIVVTSNMSPAQNVKLGAIVEGIDVIVGSGRGQSASQRVQQHPVTGAPVLLVSGGQNAESFGQTNLIFDEQGEIQQFAHRNIETNRFAENPEAKALLSQRLMPPTPLGGFMTQSANPNDRYTENPMANYLADRVRQLSGADVALVRSSEIRDKVDIGSMTQWRLFSLLPFGEQYVVKPVSGADLKASLDKFAGKLQQKAAGALDASVPSQLHPSGLRYAIANDGSGQAQAQIFNKQIGQWQNINPNQNYDVAMSEYTAGNVHVYPGLAKETTKKGFLNTDLKSLLMSDLMARKQQGKITPIRLPKDGRVVIDPSLQMTPAEF